MKNHRPTLTSRKQRAGLLGVVAICALLAGCASTDGSVDQAVGPSQDSSAREQAIGPFDAITETGRHVVAPLAFRDYPVTTGSPHYRGRVLQRAIQTEGATSVTPAHYGHVIAGPNSPAISSLSTIPLADAVHNNILIDQDYAVKEITSIKETPKKWVILEKPFDRPSEMEGAGGEKIEDGIYAVVPFEKKQYQADNLSTLLGPMVRRAQVVPGAFYVVGYTKQGERADPANELKNKLSKERALFIAKAIEDAGIPKSNIKVSDGGVSHLDTSDHPASRVSVSFRAFR
jgi:hypothetical protein